jgi:hypothetical protein
MPTVEELQTQIETLKAEHAGRIEKYKQDLDTATAHAIKITEERDTFKSELSAYKKAERDELIAKVHAIKKDYPVTDQSDKELKAYIHGYELAKTEQSAAGQTPPPKPNSQSSTPEDSFSSFFKA